MTVAELFNKCEDNQKLVINVFGYQFRGNWYQDIQHMILVPISSELVPGSYAEYPGRL